MSIARTFTDTFHKEFVSYYSLRQPNRTLEIGEVGELRSSGLFEPVTTLADLGVPLSANDIVLDDAPSAMKYVSRKGTTITIKAEGAAQTGFVSVPTAKAGLRIDFANEGSFVMVADESYEHRLRSPVNLEPHIRQLAREGLWRSNFAVVAAVVQTPYVDILVSRSRKVSVELTAEGSADIGSVRLGNAGLGFTLTKSSEAVYEMLRSKNVTPAFRLLGLRRRLFRSSRLSPLERGRFSIATDHAPTGREIDVSEDHLVLDDLTGEDPLDLF